MTDFEDAVKGAQAAINLQRAVQEVVCAEFVAELRRMAETALSAWKHHFPERQRPLILWVTPVPDALDEFHIFFREKIGEAPIVSIVVRPAGGVTNVILGSETPGEMTPRGAQDLAATLQVASSVASSAARACLRWREKLT